MDSWQLERQEKLTAIEALHAGDVIGAMSQLKNEVRDRPQAADLRVFRFQLFAVTGEWDRALSQLKVASELDGDCQTMADAYQHILRCEALREEVFSKGRSPLVLGEPEPWVASAIEAARLYCDGNYQNAAALQGEAYQDAPTSTGSFTLRSADETPNSGLPEEHGFEWIADADSRIGPFVEAIVQGKYYWVPFHRIKCVEFHPINDLRDFVWIPAQFTWKGGGEMVGMVPVRYPSSEKHTDGLIQLGRKTIWEEKSSDTYFGLGQRMFATGESDVSLLDIATMSFED